MNKHKNDKYYQKYYRHDSFQQLPVQIQKDLIAWNNVVKKDLDEEDFKLLLDLYNKQKFEAWNCPECGERCYMGYPDSWDDFQGTCQNDYTSFPGQIKKFSDKYNEALCDNCRRKV